MDWTANDTFIILMPKESANKLEDYRPISLCNIRYKIISKILANRIRPLLSKCISQVQGAFLPGRRPGDNIIIAKEVIHNMSKANRKKKYCDTAQSSSISKTLMTVFRGASYMNV